MPSRIFGPAPTTQPPHFTTEAAPRPTLGQNSGSRQNALFRARGSRWREGKGVGRERGMYGTVRSATPPRSCSCGTKSLWRRKGSALAAYLALALALLLLPFLRPLLVFRPHITISPYKPIYYFFPSIFLCSSLTHPLPLSSPSLPPPYHPYIIIII